MKKSQYSFLKTKVFVLLLGIANLAFAYQTSITGKVTLEMEGFIPHLKTGK